MGKARGCMIWMWYLMESLQWAWHRFTWRSCGVGMRIYRRMEIPEEQ